MHAGETRSALALLSFFVLVALGGCHSDLSRREARTLIESHDSFSTPISVCTTQLISEGEREGLWTVSPGYLGRGRLSLTGRGRKHFKAIQPTDDVVNQLSDRPRLIQTELAEPLRRQSVEITGIEMGGKERRKAQFNFGFVGDETALRYCLPSSRFSSEAEFQLYDDGWRIARISERVDPLPGGPILEGWKTRLARRIRRLFNASEDELASTMDAQSGANRSPPSQPTARTGKPTDRTPPQEAEGRIAENDSAAPKWQGLNVASGAWFAADAISVRPQPGGVVMEAGRKFQISYLFHNDGPTDTIIGSRYAYFLTSDLRRLTPKIGPFETNVIVPANGATTWTDDAYLPPDVVSRARELGSPFVLLHQQFVITGTGSRLAARVEVRY